MNGHCLSAWKARQLAARQPCRHPPDPAFCFALLFFFQRLTQWAYVKKGLSVQQNDGLAKSLGILPASTASPDVFAAVRHPGLPRDLLIGSAPSFQNAL